jgi:hypothetical protein
MWGRKRKMDNYGMLRAYIMTKPGALWASSNLKLLTKVKLAAGINADRADLQKMLFSCGYTPERVGMLWRLSFPSSPPEPS